ncbi:hypothetical protein PFISCL1PPCAC_21889, partial [Pristionchus fissidentatus]
SDVMTDNFLRDLLSTKKVVDISMMCERITAPGLFAVWKDLLDGKFDGLSIIVGKDVVLALFDLIRTDGQKSSWKDGYMKPIYTEGTRDTSE